MLLNDSSLLSSKQNMSLWVYYFSTYSIFSLFIGIISTNLLTELDIDRLGIYIMPMFH